MPTAELQAEGPERARVLASSDSMPIPPLRVLIQEPAHPRSSGLLRLHLCPACIRACMPAVYRLISNHLSSIRLSTLASAPVAHKEAALPMGTLKSVERPRIFRTGTWVYNALLHPIRPLHSRTPQASGTSWPPASAAAFTATNWIRGI